MRKKCLSIILLLTMCILSLVGCGNNSKKASSSSDGELNVGVCIYNYSDNFMTLYRTELQSYLESQDCKEQLWMVRMIKLNKRIKFKTLLQKA